MQELIKDRKLELLMPQRTHALVCDSSSHLPGCLWPSCCNCATALHLYLHLYCNAVAAAIAQPGHCPAAGWQLAATYDLLYICCWLSQACCLAAAGSYKLFA
ncbi:hypothetical protein Acr_00g0085630 [Actinidia rufa]|uniref:Uncharacterized protein n=1 Tax=Actinidia rufa TaxID=165716 RepID=A0A7J0DVT2_9ERIC|nr:hypothetical protein Acr_00g0085630 [Actinidia rufa]